MPYHRWLLWLSYPFGGNGSFPCESLSLIWPFGRWITNSDPWCCEIWRATSIAAFCVGVRTVAREFPAPLTRQPPPGCGVTCWFFPITHTSFQPGNTPTVGASRWIGHRNDFLAATANVIFVFDCHCLYAPLKYDVICHHIFRKKSALIFSFLDTDFILQSRIKRGTM